MSQSKDKQQKKPRDIYELPFIPDIARPMEPKSGRVKNIESLFKEKFGLQLEEALLFAEDMVDVIIPEGRDQNDYLVIMAIDRGINSRKLPVAYVPASVTKDLQLLKLKQLYGGARGDRAEKEICAIQCGQNLDQIKGVIEQIRAQVEAKRLIFHGVVNSSIVSRLIAQGFQYVSSNFENPCEFGNGIYCSYQLEYAFQHISKYQSAGQAILVFDWSCVDDLEYHYIQGQEWKMLVKQNVCIHNELKMREIGFPPELFESFDVVEGSITKNYKAIQSCSDPISGTSTQVVVLRHYGRILFPRLVGLIYLK
ncbi:hypothetical protein MIR68_010898 [Amoeboaphelidium protococcarum]|nr:hypothetical protein MIR68_010898 [Amoeboaphelidium protococcarum]